MIRVLLADDQALVRAGFRVLLDSAPDIEVVGEAASGEQALSLAKSSRPDVILDDSLRQALIQALTTEEGDN